MTIKNKDKLMSDLSQFILRFESFTRMNPGPPGSPNADTKLGSFEVKFFKDGEELASGSLGWALDCLANDIFWDAEHDWREADSLSIGTY